MEELDTSPVRHRVFFTVAALLIAASLLFLLWPRITHQSDFDLQVQAAKALLAGENPYRTVGPSNERFFIFPYYYPLPSAFFALPFVWLPVNAIRVLYVLITTGILGWVASRQGWLRTPIFFSGAFINAVMIGQWSMVLTASLLVPALAWVAGVKPNFALAFSAAQGSRRYFVSFLIPAVLLAVAAMLFVPTWPLDWLNIIRSTPPNSHSAPILYQGGFLVLLALLRWRTFEGRLLVGMACVPQTGLLYDTLPLFLVAKNQVQGWILTAFSLVGLFVQTMMTGMYLTSSSVTVAEFIPRFNAFRVEVGETLVLLMYVPALAIVLYNGIRDVRHQGGGGGDARQRQS